MNIFNERVVIENKFPVCHFERHNSKQGRRYIFILTPTKTNQLFPGLIKALRTQNMLAVLSHNRIDIFEPNYETRFI